MKSHAINSLFERLGELVVPNSCDVVVLEGKLDRPRLRGAILSTLARHPILNAQRDLDLRFHGVVEDAAVDEYLVGLIWDEPFASRSRPIRFHVVETRSRTYFQTIHTHVYADATSCYTITEQIAAAYAGVRAKPDVDDFAESDVTALVSEPLSLRDRIASRARAAVKTVRDLATPFAGLATKSPRKPGKRRIARVVLTRAETKRLRAAARERGHSIHAFFQLAFLRTATEFNRARNVERPALRVWDFFSLRPLLGKAKDRYDCLALVYPVDFDARWSDDQVLAHCTANVERMRNGELVDHAHRFDLWSRIVPRRAFAAAWTALFKSNVFLTNPGVCPSPLPSFGELPVVDYVTFPQLFFPAELMFVFSTFRDELRILVTYDEDAFEAFHQDLFGPFLDRLFALAGLDQPAKTGDGFVASWTSSHRTFIQRSA